MSTDVPGLSLNAVLDLGRGCVGPFLATACVVLALPQGSGEHTEPEKHGRRGGDC